MSRYRFAWAWCVGCVLLARLAAAAPVALCDPADPVVPGRLLEFRPKADTSLYLGLPNAIVFAVDAPTVVAQYGRVPTRALDKCSGDPLALVPMTAQDLAAIAAAELAAQQAAAQASYGAVGCTLVEGDAIIGVCEDGTIVTSPRLELAVLDVIKRRMSVEDGEYLVRWGAQLIGAPALPSGAAATGAPAFVLNGSETAITGANVTFTANTPLSRYAFNASVRLSKDGGTTARVVTLRLRRASDNALIGQPCVIRSQAVASSEMGSCAWNPIDGNPPAGATTYAITGQVGAGNATVTAFDLRLQESR